MIDTTAPTVTQRQLVDGERHLRGRRDDLDPGHFSETVTVTGTPQLALNSGAHASTTPPARAPHADLHLHRRPPATARPTSTTRDDRAGAQRRHDQGHRDEQRDADPADARRRREPRRRSKAHRDRRTAPTVSSVNSSTANGSYKAGATVSIQVNFSENVTVTGTPQLALNSGAHRQLRVGLAAPRRSPSPTRSPRGENERRPRLQRHDLADAERRHDQGRRDEQRDADAGRARRGGQPRQREEHRHRHHRPDGHQRHLDAPPTAPTRPARRSRSGHFSENVTVTGTPQLALNSGATVELRLRHRHDTLTFTYTVAGGENARRPRLHATTSLTLNGGTIKDAATNNATLTLPAPGAAGSLGNAKDIVIDTTAPTVSSASPRRRRTAPTRRRRRSRSR